MRVAEQLTGEERRIQDVLVLDAVDAAARSTSDVSVADVAHQLGIDRSGASRFVADVVEHGYLHRSPSTADARRAVLTVTEAGQDLLTGSHAWQEDIYAQLISGWDHADAIRFAGYLRRLARELADPSTSSSPSSPPRST